MFQVKSYILKPGRNVTDLDDVARNPQNDFVEITDLKGLESIRRKLDFKRPIRARIGESKKKVKRLKEKLQFRPG